jgi:hypothetical protein
MTAALSGSREKPGRAQGSRKLQSGSGQNIYHNVFLRKRRKIKMQEFV